MRSISVNVMKSLNDKISVLFFYRFNRLPMGIFKTENPENVSTSCLFCNEIFLFLCKEDRIWCDSTTLQRTGFK